MQVAREPADLDSIEAGHGHGNSDEAGHTLTSNNWTHGNNDNKTDQKPRAKPKQKRNKPTLSCLECVERKTKCDRARPCLACVKRQSTCEYTAVANLIASADRKNSHPGSKARYIKPPNKVRRTSLAKSPLSIRASPAVTDNGSTHHRQQSEDSSPILFSNGPISQQSAPSNVFGVGSQHPFANYWTCQGGLPEVITVLPNKDQADVLVAKYFEVFDSCYPMTRKVSFYSDYEFFWALEDKGKADASLVALHYAVYALGTQFMQFTPLEERSQTAEFYCSAANQALRVYSYLNRTSMRAIQAMLLMSYFLMNDNHASDAYAWAGIHLRQSYALRLHRDPDVVVPEASTFEKQQRRKLWQAVFFHDTFLTLLLKLPPTATHSDVPVESLSDENELSDDGIDVGMGTHSRIENLMSINVIAPQVPQPLPPPQPHHTTDRATMKADIAYMRSMWHLANLVQECLSSPIALSLPVANSVRHKESLVGAFQRLYKTFPAQLTILDYDILQQQANSNPRVVRQNLFLTSNYYHSLMLLQASENRAQGVEPNVKAALEAAHQALSCFFKLFSLFEVEAVVWWAFQHRAFEESQFSAKCLAIPPPPGAQSDPIYAKAKEDVGRMLNIMERYGSDMEMHKTRKDVLREAYLRIVV
ncbi:Oleate activated transcription factor 3 [Cercospora zeina]